MKLRDLLLVTSEDVFGVIYYNQNTIYKGSLREVFDLSEEDGNWVLEEEVFSIALTFLKPLNFLHSIAINSLSTSLS